MSGGPGPTGLSQLCVPAYRKEGHPNCASSPHVEVFSDPPFVTVAPSACLVTVHQRTCSVESCLPPLPGTAAPQGKGCLSVFFTPVLVARPWPRIEGS